jgi:hypothetical protein
LRPAKLLIRLHELLDHDEPQTAGQLLDGIAKLLPADPGEALLAIQNAWFLGVLRGKARLQRDDLTRESRDNLLRQAVVVACSALEAFLRDLLLTNLEDVARVRGIHFLDTNEERVMNYLSQWLTFKPREVLRFLTTPQDAVAWLSAKIFELARKNAMTGVHGMTVTASLLGINDAWQKMARHIDAHPGEVVWDAAELEKLIDRAAKRRNDIIHRMDRGEEDDRLQPIDRAEVEDWVNAAEAACTALDELVAERLLNLEVSAEGPAGVDEE